ncbi:MAG: transcriptional regulator [Candidatus Bathyarchaeia archaeon]
MDVLLLVVGVLGIIVYDWLVFLAEWSLFVLQMSVFIAIAVILTIISWIGYTLVTTPPLKPVEEIEKEIEEELKRVEETSKSETEKAGEE